MRKISTLAALAAATLATPAFAQDSESSFDGFYLGAYAGYDKVAIKDVDTGDSESKDGAAFGAIIGYNVDLGSALVGIEAEIGDASTKQSYTDFLEAGDEISLSANLDLFIGARIGVKPSDKSLVYLKAGYANTKATIAYDGSFGTFSESDNLDGYRLGAGIEIAATDRLFVRGEYRYTNYGEYSYEGTPTGLSANRHQVLIGVVSRF